MPVKFSPLRRAWSTHHTESESTFVVSCPLLSRSWSFEDGRALWREFVRADLRRQFALTLETSGFGSHVFADQF